MPVTPTTLSAEGPSFSRLVAGLWRLDSWNMTPGELLTWIETCLELGITTFDHADIYGDYTCEQRFGEALALNPGLRKRMQIVTKCGIKLVSPNRPEHILKHYDTSKAHILASVDTSLRQLGTDYVDLLLIHRPDPLMDPDDIAEAFHLLRQSGKVLHFGVSNFTPSQFALLASRVDVPLVTNQIECSVLKLDFFLDGTLDQCQQYRIAPMAWSPLGGGRLFRSSDERAVRVREALCVVGEQLNGAGVDQVALAWLLRHPSTMLPVLGTSRVERLRSAAAAVDLHLSREQWFTIWTASTGTDIP